MNNWKKVSLGTLALASVGLLAACGNGGGDSKTATPQLSVPTNIATLDSGSATDTYSNLFIGNTQEGLTRVDEEGVAQNALASDIKVSDDGLTYTITLREGLKWSNGDSLTANDFLYSWQRAVNPATGSQYAYLLGNIKNANEINSGKIKDLNELGVKVKGDTEIVVTLTQPTPYFKFLLANSVYMPVNKGAVEEFGKQYGTSSDKVVYSGPFMFKKDAGWTGTNNSYSLVKNPDYYDKDGVKSEEIGYTVQSNPNTAVQLFKQGKLDQASLNTMDLYNANKDYNDGKDLVVLKEATTAYLQYNQSGGGTSSPEVAKALQNKNIRDAINLATDRKGIVDQFIPAGTVAETFTPAGMSVTADGTDFAEFAKQDYKYDAAKAKELWEKGLKEVGVTSLNIQYTTDADAPVSKSTADFLQASLSKALPGLTLTQKIVPFQQRLKDSQNQNFDIVLSLWGGDYAEPSTFLQLFADGSGYNDGKFDNPAYQAAWTKASTLPTVLDDKARDEAYKEAETALFSESSINPLYYRATPALRNQHLKGLQFNSTGLTYDLKGVYIEK
ncbi:peptide ABC transporter substrate-binding protein [Lactococcus garvieae]|uniref:Oligopeptide ABC transporter, periplasmic oligopeptide-binding protein OppA n=1 Tax=Lactococcus garvieae DCC43 TaxID=1231377 RepID=K2PYC1_9LACT|nr:peptide ABC transporter substrate-binding protein [Lactococcus garvieae]EKF52441.1 Oligopeptide ABC transporter, periplasmic oligopeptide-binding protein OppA [Lactococcus garvieae DCC43]